MINPTLHYQKINKELVKRGASKIGFGDYGTVYKLGDRAFKVTADVVEIAHAKKLRNFKTHHIVAIHRVVEHSSKLATIEMELLNTPAHTPSIKELNKLRNELLPTGIDFEELDIRDSNFMTDSKGNVKMVDV